MRKNVFAIGILLILVGAVLTACHSASVKANVNKVVNGVEKKLSVSGYFNSSQVLILGILPGKYWDKPFFEPLEPGLPPHKIVTVYVIDPHNDTSVFEVHFVDQGFFYHWTVVNQSSGFTPTITETSWMLEGIAQLSGNYTATIALVIPSLGIISPEGYTQIPLEEDPPAKMELITLKLEIKYPFTWFLPVGIAVVIAGILASAWSITKSKTSKKFRKKGLSRHRAKN